MNTPVIVIVVVVAVVILVVHWKAGRLARALARVQSRPGPETCAKDEADPFTGSRVALQAPVCADGICCFTALSQYTPSVKGGLPIKVFVRGQGLERSFDPCKHLAVQGTLDAGKLRLQFRCGCYTDRPAACRQYPEDSKDGCTLCTYNEYLAPYAAYPFGHWVLYYGFPNNEADMRTLFPQLNAAEVLQVLRNDPFCSVQSESGTEFVAVPVPKQPAVLYTSDKHPPVQTLSQALAAWPGAIRTKYQVLYGSLADQVLHIDLQQERRRF